MKKASLLCAIAAFTTFNFSFAQSGSIGIGEATPDPSASLDLGAIDKGLLTNRVSLTSTTTWGLSGATDVAGMLVYNTNAAITGTSLYPATIGGVGIYYWDGDGWVAAKAAGASVYGFSAQSASSQSYDDVSFGTTSVANPTVVSFGTTDILVDEAGTLDAATGVITINYDGIYDIYAFVNFRVATGTLTEPMFVNLSVEKLDGGSWTTISGSRTAYPISNATITTNTSSLVPLDAGDQIRVVIFRGAGGTLPAGGSASSGGGFSNGVSYTKGIKILRVKAQ